MHAAVEAARKGLIPAGVEHPHLVLCRIASIPSLVRAAERLARAGIPHCLFHEPDLDNAPTALATAPVCGEDRALFRRFQLLQE